MLVVVIVVACIVGGGGKIVEGVRMPYKNNPDSDSGIISYCACAVTAQLYKPQSPGIPWEWQRRACEAAVKCENGQCELPPDRRNS